MKLLTGKKILITGIYNKYSIAYGIAKSIKKQGAKLAFTYQKKKDYHKILHYLKKFNSNIILECDVTKTKNIKQLVIEIKKKWNKIDGLIHAISYTQKTKFQKNFFQAITKKNFLITHTISSYSFLEIVKIIKPILNKKSSLVTLTYIGSNKIIPNYGIMSSAKASLEANTKYMAYIMGSDEIRVNAISSGIIRTTSARSIKNFHKILKYTKLVNPIKKIITTKDIGNTAAFLCSDLSSGITGEIIHVDGGFHIL